MWIRSNDFEDGQSIPPENAFCVPDRDDHATFSSNQNPHLVWGGVPEGTVSLAILVVDVDVPTKGDDVNLEGREVPADLARTDFVHWVIINIPAELDYIERGQYSDGVTPHGKPIADGRPEQGVNDYTSWFAGDPAMEGTYRGYDGPCPPWNDSIIHHYEFRCFALDADLEPPASHFTAADVMDAMSGHVLDRATLTGTYTMNPRLI